MKHLKLFEEFGRYTEILKRIENAKPGDIFIESDIYQFVEYLHWKEEDFLEGDLGDRIEHYPEYQLQEVNIKDIDIDEFYWDENTVNEYTERLKEEDYYPPIVIAHDGRIIDGTHRANALDQMGYTKILAFVGIGNDNVYSSSDY